jgi:hypothetical protein
MNRPRSVEESGMKRLACLVALLAAGGCTKKDAPNPQQQPKPEPKVEAPAADAKPAAPPDPCTPEALKLTRATKLERWTPPGGCTLKGDQNRFIRSDAEATAHLECPAGTKLGVDFTKQAVAVSPTVLYPSTQGFTAYDDGKTLTVVIIARQLCPGEPRATPMPDPSWFLVPAGEARTFAETSCVYPCK